ncbi:zinc-binding dehydrogenase [Mesorhizobium sp. SB112]|uniref:quinone oxidoreductase family protein n=1 Tax=Mesorhizobium sp. SB112 TaxID=3151853 RepID=UPI003264EF17
MKAAVYRTNGDPKVLTWEEIADPEVGPATVLIRVACVAIQGGDILNRRKVPPPNVPHVVGYQAAGTVEAVGSEVKAFKVGDKVAAFAFDGSHAELFATDQSYVYPVPQELELTTAAVLPVEFGTASDGLFEFGRLTKGETVLVRGAAGGVGLAAVQLAHRAGAQVIAVAATPERLRKIADFGADHGIDYKSEDVVARVQEITGGRGVDLVLDMAGGNPIFDACARRGRYGLIGAAGGGATSVSFEDLLLKSLTVFSFMFGQEMGTERVRTRIEELMQLAVRGEIVMPIAKTFKLSAADEAHSFVESGSPVGRVLMTTAR